MLLVDKYSNVLDDKKEAVVTKILSENKLLTTKKVTTSYEVQKRTEKFTTSEEVVKGIDEVKNEDFDKCTDKLEYMKEALVKICRKYSDNLRVIIKYLQDDLILIMSIKNKMFYT